MASLSKIWTHANSDWVYIATFESQIIMHYQSWDCAISQCWDSTRALKTVPFTVSTHNINMFCQPLVCCASHLCSVGIACIILRLVVCKLDSKLWKSQSHNEWIPFEQKYSNLYCSCWIVDVSKTTNWIIRHIRIHHLQLFAICSVYCVLFRFWCLPFAFCRLICWWSGTGQTSTAIIIHTATFLLTLAPVAKFPTQAHQWHHPTMAVFLTHARQWHQPIISSLLLPLGLLEAAWHLLL